MAGTKQQERESGRREDLTPAPTPPAIRVRSTAVGLCRCIHIGTDYLLRIDRQMSSEDDERALPLLVLSELEQQR